MYENRQYVIFDTTELDKVNFDEVLETSADTVRRSTDGAKTFVKWTGDVPACVLTLDSASEYLIHEEMLTVLATEEWTSELEDGIGS